MRLTEHAKLRMKERTNLNHKERKQLFRQALNNGKSYHQIKDKRLQKYIDRKQKVCKAKVYKGYVFIYSKNGKSLYTMYKLPEVFEEEGVKK